MTIKRDITWRVGVIYLALVVLAVFVFGKVVYLQLVEGQQWRAMEEKMTSKEREIEANRGNVLACDGRKLACSVPSYRLYMDMMAHGLTDDIFNANIDSLSIELAHFFKDKSASTYKKNLRRARQQNKRYYRIHTRRVSFTELKEIKSFPIFRLGKNVGGFIPEQQDRRKKPFGILASRTIGKLYEEKEKGGMVGLERAFNEDLKGQNGVNTFTRISGRWVPEEVMPPRNGNDVMTSIDIEIQDVAENSLKQQLIKHNAHHGVAILMEVETGAIKALVNLHRKSEGNYIEDYFNYAIGEPTEPGSTFKLASIMAALEDGYINLEDSIDTGRGVCKFYDRTMKDSHHGGFGKITYRQVFEKSSNVGISKMIVQHYKSNPKRFIDRIYGMGLNKKHGLEIKGEGDPMIKYPGSKNWWGTSLPWISIGYESQLTPLQTLAFYNAVANNGKMMKPMFVHEIKYHGKVLQHFDEEVLKNSLCSRETLRKVKSMLEGVVLRGTATNLRNSSYSIAGKTGTAQIADKNKGYGHKVYQASFAGYFPADNPKYSCIVVINSPDKKKGFYGNQVAGPVFKTIADKVYAMTYAMHPPKQDEQMCEIKVPISLNGHKDDLDKVFEELDVKIDDREVYSDWVLTSRQDSIIKYKNRTINNHLVPNVKGMGLQDALYILENAGLKVKVSGFGSVKKQSLSPGSNFRPGNKIHIELS